MNDVQKAVVQHMVEALEQATPHLPVHTDWHFEAIEAGKALLEQPKRKPVGYAVMCAGMTHLIAAQNKDMADGTYALYAEKISDNVKALCDPIAILKAVGEKA